jgi:uncharacterized Zn finger protein/DNA-binding transcriptional regulator YiaG
LGLRPPFRLSLTLAAIAAKENLLSYKFWWRKKTTSRYSRRKDHALELKNYAETYGPLRPITLSGRDLAHTFWGKSWCAHFEGMADYENRLPRGRTYARNGSLVHLDISPGKIFAIVTGTEVYKININIAPLARSHWELIKKKCHGKISTMLDLLNGKFSPEVMQVVSDPVSGLFPTSSEISYRCSCPDSARLCKHLAAVFYGVGNRLDASPEMLFTLRQVEPIELLTVNAEDIERLGGESSGELADADLNALFGVELRDEEDFSRFKPPARAGAAPVRAGAAPVRAGTAPARAEAAPARPETARARAEASPLAPRASRPAPPRSERDDKDRERANRAADAQEERWESRRRPAAPDVKKAAPPRERSRLERSVLAARGAAPPLPARREASPAPNVRSLQPNSRLVAQLAHPSRRVAPPPEFAEARSPQRASRGAFVARDAKTPAASPRNAVRAEKPKREPRAPDFANITGPQILKLRKALGESQAETSRQIGVSSASLGRWERTVGRVDLREEYVELLASWYRKNFSR